MTTGSSYESLPQPTHQPSPQPYPPAAYQQPLAPPATGALPYGLGFLAYIPIPYLNLIIAGIVMASIYPSQKTKGDLAAENARNAANWGLSLILYMVLDILFFVILLVSNGDSTGFFPVGIPVVIFLALGVAHLVVIIMGLVAANKRAVLRNRIAIPFMR
jgi:uncharacterized Tic20 family protein